MASIGGVFAEEAPSRTTQAITCRAGNICTYPDGTVVHQAEQGPSSSVPDASRRKTAASTIYVLDGDSYTRDALISDFLRIAFASALWFENNTDAQVIFKSPVINEKRSIFGPPWATEYITRSKGLPRFDALNRWNAGVITVGVDWPPDVWPSGDLSHHEIILEHLATLAPKIREATGLKLSILPPASETAETYAHIRIVTNAVFSADNQFKNPLRRTGGAANGAMVMPMAAAPPFEEYIFGSIPFTPSATRQVEGYFIPNHDNTIGFAVCKISPDHDSRIQKSLITECLTRALGLPEASFMADHSALGMWNQDNNHVKPITAHKIAENIPAQLTEYDAFMLSLLYCPEIHFGMGRYDVLFSLYRSDVCFRSLQKKM